MGFFFESSRRRKINVLSFVWLRVELTLEDALDLRELRATDRLHPDLDHRRDRGRRHLAIDSSYRGYDTEPPARSKGLAGLSISVRNGPDLADCPRVQTLAHGGPSSSAQCRSNPVRHTHCLARPRPEIHCSGSLSNRAFHRRSARGCRTRSWYCVLAGAQPGKPRRGRRTGDEHSELIAKDYGGRMLDGGEVGQPASIPDG